MTKSSMPQQRKKEVWVGSRLPVGILVDQTQQLAVDLWVEGSTGVVRMAELVPADSDLGDFSRTLQQAVSQPMAGAEIYRPGAILVDRSELMMALGGYARELDIEVEVRASVAEDLREIVEDMERHLTSIQGYGFLVDKDVDPALVAKFYQQAHRFLDLEPWRHYHSEELLEIKGLRPESLFCSILGADGEIGLGLYLSREAVETLFSGGLEVDDEELTLESLAFMLYSQEEIGSVLASEMEEHGWKSHPLGVPILMRGDRPERSNPTNEEILLMTKTLEAVIYYVEQDDVELMPFELSTGEIVKVSSSEEFEERLVDFDDPIEVLTVLDQLWSEGDVLQAAALSSGYLYDTNYEDEPILYRLALYLCQLDEYEKLSVIWRELEPGCSAEWYYVGSFFELQRGHVSTGTSRLKKAIKRDMGIARRLLGVDPEDDFARLWKPAWESEPKAWAVLQEMLAQGTVSTKTAKTKSKAKAKSKAKKSGTKKAKPASKPLSSATPAKPKSKTAAKAKKSKKAKKVRK